MWKIKVNEVATIHSGVRNTSFKNKEENYEYKIITLNNVNKHNINKCNMETLKTDKKLNDKYLLKKGDIIMKLTPPYTSRIIEFEENNITTTSNHAIIKVKDNITPELLNFYLNSEYTQKQIYKFSEQTSIKIITITNIKNFNIKNIDDKDGKITQLIKTFNQKKRLIEEKLELEESVIEEIIFGEK